jgi:hypothetical protein
MCVLMHRELKLLAIRFVVTHLLRDNPPLASRLLR